MTRHEFAVRLFAKATQDEVAVDRLINDVSVADEVVGFHLQQAAEKLLKAVLAQHGIDVRKTHNLVYLIDRLGEYDVSLPAHLLTLHSLNPFAVEYCYELLDDEVLPPLNRAQFRDMVRDLRAWAAAQVQCRGWTYDFTEPKHRLYQAHPGRRRESERLNREAAKGKTKEI